MNTNVALTIPISTPIPPLDFTSLDLFYCEYFAIVHR